MFSIARGLGVGALVTAGYAYGGTSPVPPTPLQPNVQYYPNPGGGGGIGGREYDLEDLCDRCGLMPDECKCRPRLYSIPGGRAHRPAAVGSMPPTPVIPSLDPSYLKEYTEAFHARVMEHTKDQTLTASWLEWRKLIAPNLTPAEQAQHLMKFEKAYAEEQRMQKIKTALRVVGITWTLWRILSA